VDRPLVYLSGPASGDGSHTGRYVKPGARACPLERRLDGLFPGALDGAEMSLHMY